jgi:tetratricopeptide (TPR) repeat protein
MSVLVLGVGGAALAKTPAGERAQVSLKSAYEHVVKLRADALAHRAPPAPTPRAVVAVGSAPAEVSADPAEPVAAPAAPPVPGEPSVASREAGSDDDDGEVDEQQAPGAAPPAALVEADQVDLTNEPEVEVRGVAQNDTVSQSEPAALEDSSVIAQSEALWEKGAKLRALALLKRASKRTPNDASVQKALVARAEQMAEWGEAVKAARRWASLDPSSEARLSLARLERATGHKDRALALIDGVIKEEPSSPDAKTLLAEIRGQKLALSQ